MLGEAANKIQTNTAGFFIIQFNPWPHPQSKHERSAWAERIKVSLLDGSVNLSPLCSSSSKSLPPNLSCKNCCNTACAKLNTYNMTLPISIWGSSMICTPQACFRLFASLTHPPNQANTKITASQEMREVRRIAVSINLIPSFNFNQNFSYTSTSVRLSCDIRTGQTWMI